MVIASNQVPVAYMETLVESPVFRFSTRPGPLYTFREQTSTLEHIQTQKQVHVYPLLPPLTQIKSLIFF